MKKVFGIAAMLLALAACNKIETEIQTTDQAEGITITAQLAPKTGGATTRAVSEGSGMIVSDWAKNEHIAVLYTVGSTKYAADATITAVDYDLSATITFTVEAGTPNNTACTLVYPLSAAKDDHTGVKDAATLLAAQDGTLNANLDVRVGDGTIQTTTPGLTVTTQPEAQFAIFKFTTKNSDGSATINVKPLTVTIGAQDYVITPASATSTLFAALPPISSQAVTFTATGSDSKTYTCSKASVSFDAGKYYQSTLKMASAVPPAEGHALSASVLGEIVGSDGLAYAVVDKGNLPTGVTAVAIVAYKSGSNGLAIALTDETGTMNWTTAKSTCEGKTAVGGNSWHLPSQPEWKQMFAANGGDEESFTGLNTAITTAGGTGITKWRYYWTSSLDGSYPIYISIQSWVQYDNPDSEGGAENCYVRACLAF